MISNPPYGRKWEGDKDVVLKEAELGYDGRFGAGLPRINDGQLLFLEHMISKMKTNERSRIAVITNGSPLFTGDAGSGESNIRKWIIENDYLEAIVGLPDQLFYNTGIKTYIYGYLQMKRTKEDKEEYN
jgi:type I restriction enzyme M protein